MLANLRLGTLTSMFVLAAASASAAGAVLITSTRYEQDFNGLAKSGTGNNFSTAASGTEGWAVARWDSNSVANYYTIQYGSTSFSAQNNSIDRYACVNGSDVAFGARQGTNSAFAIGVLLRNASAAPITRVQISSVLELWRRPNPTPGNAGWLDWGIGPGTMSESNSAPWTGANYSHVGTPTFLPRSTDPLYKTYDISATLNLSSNPGDPLAWDPGETLVLRWYFPAAFAPNTANVITPVLALDDVQLTFTGAALPEPALALTGVYVIYAALTLRPLRLQAGRSAGTVCRRQRRPQYHR